MRLIDADRFEAYCYDTVKGDYHDGVRRVLEDIDKAETIEAIPIEWIWNWINTKGVFAQYISDMIEDWKKENEIDKCR